MTKAIAAFISLSLIVVSPGVPCYAAMSRGVVARGATPGARVIGGVAPSIFSSVPSLSPSVPVSRTIPLNAVPTTLPAAAPTAAAPSIGIHGAKAQPKASALTLLNQKAQLSLPTEQAAAMPAASAHEAGQAIIDRVVGAPSHASAELSVAGQPSLPNSLTPARPQGPGASFKPPTPPNRPVAGGSNNGPRRSKIGAFLGMAARVALGAGIVLGVQAAGAALLPAIFGLVPVAAVWAVSSGMLLLPAAVYARYRLAKRDSPRLKPVKRMLDVVIGAYIGAVVIAVPALSVTLASYGSAALPLAAAAGAGSVISAASGGRLVDVALTGGVLAAAPVLMAAATAGAIGLAPLLGMMALPAMTTIAFFLGPIIRSAETGGAFAVPGTMQKFRFPAFNWVMTGVVFALVTGFSAVHTNVAFFAWMFLGNKGKPTWNKNVPVWRNILGFLLNFNVLYLGLLAFTAATGFTNPLTFLVLAFAPERAAIWTEGLLSRMLGASEAAPSTLPSPQTISLGERIERRWPAFHHWTRTFILLGSMAGMGLVMGATVFGFSSLLTNLAVASLLAFLPFFFAKKIIKAVMRAQPTDAQKDPEVFAIMTELRDKINAKRAAAGKKLIPMPEIVNVPMDVPNAFATGRSPFDALVGVTNGIKEMLLDPEGLRDGLVRLMAAVEPQGDSFKVFRIAMAGVIPGVTRRSTPQEVSQAVVRAGRADLHKLGVKLLRGVLGHEFSHVMDRHMLTGSIGGAISSAVAFASYGVMWGVGHARALAVKIKDRVLGRAPSAPRKTGAPADGRGGGGAQPEALDPISTGVVLKSLPALLKVFAALWGPIILQITQMAGSRNNEGQADEDGALLTQDPASLALALGMLTTWRPKPGFTITGMEMPRVAAVAHMMTVNPLQQMREAGAVPKSEAALDWVVGKGDNFLLDLFLTHPDTRLRIERLLRMSQALGHDEEPPDGQPPPSGGGGSQAPPLALGPQPGDAPAASRGVLLAQGPRQGAFRRAWDRVFRVFPDERRNREFWKFTLGQALITGGTYFHYSALAKLLAPKPELSSAVTDNRAINSGAQLTSSLATGPLVDRVSVRKTLVWTHLGRGLLMLAVPVLFFHGYFAVAIFHVIIFATGFLQSTGMTAGAVAFNRILGSDEAYYNKANAVFNTVLAVVGILAPLAAGTFIVAMDARFGFLSGNALAYGVYGVLLLAVAWLFRTLRLPKDDAVQARAAAPPGRGIAARFKELLEGFRQIWRARFLRLYLFSTTLAVMMADPIIFSVLPRHITRLEGVPETQRGAVFGLYLAAAAVGMGVASLAMMLARDKSASDLQALLAGHEAARPGSSQAVRQAVDGVLAGYGRAWETSADFDPSGRLAADVSASAAQAMEVRLDPSLAAGLSSWARKHEKRLLAQAKAQARRGLSTLERQGRWSAILRGMGWLAYLGVFFSSTLPASLAFMVLGTLLSGPAMSIWTSLLQKVIKDEAPQDMGKVYSSLMFYQLFFAILGSLLFGWLMVQFSTPVALMVAGSVLAFMALVEVVSCYIILPISGARKTGK